MNIKVSKKIFNETYFPQLLNYDKRFNVFYGGAGSGKSHFVIQKIIYKCLNFPKRKVLVIRKVGNSLRDSVFALFKSVLADWGLYEQCEVRETLLTITFPNGSEILFKGLDDSEKIKSIANIDDIVIEECTEINLQEFNQLNLRLRSKNLYNQIHVMFNPVSKSNWVYKQWFENGYNAESTVVLHTTYKDNRFLPLDYVDSLMEMKDKDPVYYRIYALGEFASLGKLIYTNWEELDFNWRDLIRQNKSLAANFGMDFGYINDPSAFIAFLVDMQKKEMFVFDEFYKKGLMNNELAKEIRKKGYSKEIIIADSAERKSIDEIRAYGIPRIMPARKGKDSILNGIQFLKQFKVYVHPSCTNFQEELKNYEWIKDKITGDYINKPIDNYNHLMDAWRYGSEKLMLKKNKYSTDVYRRGKNIISNVSEAYVKGMSIF